MPIANDSETPSPRSRPGGARHWILLFAAALAIITYIDRVCISQAAGDIQRDLGLTKVQMGWAFAAFAWAYALFEIPGGWLGDKIGPRKVLMRVVVWWSFFTAATGWVWNLRSLLVTRFSSARARPAASRTWPRCSRTGCRATNAAARWA
jgi:MFS family permease